MYQYVSPLIGGEGDNAGAPLVTVASCLLTKLAHSCMV